MVVLRKTSFAIVTHAWGDAGIASVPDLYGGKLGWLRPVAGAVRDQLTANDYEPVDIATDEFRGKLLMAGNGPDASPVQIVHQHLDAYLEWTGLAKKGIGMLKLLLT
jgi:hypothetical protein